MKRILFILLLSITLANASLISLSFKDNSGKTYTIDIKNLDEIRGMDSVAAETNIREQLMFQGMTSDKIDEYVNAGEEGLKNTSLALNFAGNIVEIKVDGSGNVTKGKDDLGLFEGFDFTGVNLDNIHELINNEDADNFAERFKTHLEALEDSGKLYAIFSKLYVQELHRKIGKTPYSVVGGNPLSTMYMLADNDYNLTVNFDKIDSYTYPQVYFASNRDANVMNAQLPLNFHFDLFGLLDYINLGFRFDLPLSYTEINYISGDKVIGGNVGVGLSVRYIFPQELINKWSLMLTYKPFVASMSYNDKLKNLDADDIMGLDDLSILPEISIFKSYSIISKKGFDIEEDKVVLSVINSLTFVDSWTKNDMEDMIERLGALDEKQKHIVPNLDLHNTFLKNGAVVEYKTFDRLSLALGATLTNVFGKTKVYVKNYLTFNFDIIGNYDMFFFERPTLQLKYIAGFNNWSSYGVAFKAEF